jgi:hypothetical protein
MRRIGRKLSYANVMSTLAVFLALSGGAFAAVKLGASSGVLSLCVSKSGKVTALGHHRACPKGSRLTSVNQQGPAGPPGPPGPAGAPSPPYSVGSGLTLSGNTLSANLSQLQARIAGSGCAPDQTLQSVSPSGAATCTSLHAYSAQAEVDIPEASIAVPPGKWVLLGQGTGADTTPSAATVYCSIEVSNVPVVTASQSVPSGEKGTAPVLASATTTKVATPISTNCNAGGGPVPLWSNVSIVAIPVAAVN